MNVRKGTIPGKGQKGSVVVIFAICLFLLIGVAALAVDIGYVYTTRSELQNVADAAALAGARYLGSVYVTLSPSQMSSHVFTQTEVYAAVEAVANQNKAANKSISINSGDVVIGYWRVDTNPDDVIQSYVGPDAVRVIARRDTSSAQGQITTFLARVFNIDAINVVSEKAIAALTGPSTMEEEKLTTPFGISTLNQCESPIYFTDTRDSCAGWHNFFWDHNASDLTTFGQATILRHQSDTPGMDSGETWLRNNFSDLNLDNLAADLEKKVLEGTPIPEIYETGQEFDFIGGGATALFNGCKLDTSKPYDGNLGTITGTPTNSPAPMFALFDYFRFRDGDGDNSKWTATVPVYKDIDVCSNPSGDTKIVGYAKVEILNVYGPPANKIDVILDCDLVVEDGRGSGTTYGNLKGTIPNLVK